MHMNGNGFKKSKIHIAKSMYITKKILLMKTIKNERRADPIFHSLGKSKICTTKTSLVVATKMVATNAERGRLGFGILLDITLGAVVLVDPERVDAPVRLGKGRRVVLHEGVAGAGPGRAGAAAPDVAGPVTAEGDIKDLFDRVSVSEIL
jgi:hypothetical protein